MKIIPIFLKGGGFDSMFTVYTPVQSLAPRQAPQGSGGSSRKASSDDDEKGKITEKDLFGMIKEIDGLPNEMDALVRNLIRTFQLSKSGLSTEDLSTTYLKNLYQLKIAVQNKKKYDAAIENAKENGSMAEPAITMSGKIMAQDASGNVDEVTLSELKNGDGEYKPLTVSQLANLRAYDSSLLNNQEIFNIIDNSMGYEAFNKLLKQGLTMLGNSSQTSNKMYDLANINKDDAMKAIAILRDMPSDQKQRVLSGVIEGTQITKNQLRQIQNLTDYLTATVPERMKVWAAFKCNTDNKEAATKALIHSYLIAESSDSTSFTFDFENYLSRNKETTKSGSSKSGDGGLDDIKLTTGAKFLAGLGAQEVLNLNPGTSTGWQVLVNTMPITDKEGKVLGSGKTLEDVTQSDSFSGILNFESVSMAGAIVNPLNFNKVVMNTGKISSIDFPARRLPNNKIVPILDRETVLLKEKVDKVLAEKGINVQNIEDIKRNYQYINEAYKLNGLEDPGYGPDGKPSNWVRFGVINCSADGDMLELSEGLNKDLLKLLDDTEADGLIDKLKSSVGKDYQSSTTGWFGTGDPLLYKGTVWIPIQKDFNAALATEKIEAGQANGIVQQQSYNKPGTQI